MYISIKLPPAFGSFNKFRKENFPFNKLFTTYLAAISRLGLAKQMDVEELVGYIEDRVFEDERLPDVPEGDEPVNIRYKTEDPDVVNYIGNTDSTNRMAVMYIARMTLRLSVKYGTSLFRLTRLINSLDSSAEETKPRRQKTRTEQEPVQTKAEPAPKPKKTESRQEPETEKPVMPMPRVSSRSSNQEPPVQVQEPKTTSVLESANTAKAALSELEELMSKTEVEPEEEITESSENPAGDVVETSPFLGDFL